MDKWLSKLESSAWLTHIKDILTTACVVAQCMDKEGTFVSIYVLWVVGVGCCCHTIPSVLLALCMNR